jgi:aryl-alcohol dehydrogenase-like predicted oxidoreductase
MSTTSTTADAAQAGIFKIGGDLIVNRLGFGAMRITGKGIWGDPADPSEVDRVLRRLRDLNVNFIDTADSYGPEVSECLIAKSLYPYDENLIIATKGGLTRQGPDQWAPVGRPEYLKQAVEMSLRRLRLETIDLYQLHRFDPKVPKEETLGALKEMQEAGKIRHIGLSEVTVDEIQFANTIINVVSVQNLYNLSNRSAEPVLEYCHENNVGFIPWFPMASGDLARPGGKLDQDAQRHGVTVGQLALAWLLNRSPVVLPIPGTSSVKHLEENVGAASIRLTDDEFRELVALE